MSALAAAAGADNLRADTYQHRLTYVFEPSDGDHAARLRQIEVLSQPFQDDLEVVAVSRDSTPSRLAPASQIVLMSRYEVLGATVGFTRVLAWFDQIPGRGEDLLLLEDGRGNLVTASSGGEEGLTTLSHTLAAIFQRQTATEVDFSTWGKVKELFR